MTTQDYLNKAASEAREAGDYDAANELELQAELERKERFQKFHADLWDRDEHDLY